MNFDRENIDDLVIYDTGNNQIEVSIHAEKETVWLSLSQLSDLFERDRTVIGRHINNIFSEKELDEEVVCAKFAHTTKHGAIDGKFQTKEIKYYNLDVIISVGYRVKSSQATKFRQWATQKLKEYLIQGYVLNQKRLIQKEQEIQFLKNGIQILSRAIEDKSNENDLLKIFSKGLNLLDDYDHEKLDNQGLTLKEAKYPNLREYLMLIEDMCNAFDSQIFGKQKDKNFESSIVQISKGFEQGDFYPSIEEKAAMLLYLIVKNHSFVDGNKRIAAACFLLFLKQNEMIFNGQNQLIVSNDTLASLTLYIAASKPEEIQTVKRLIISVLNRNQ